MFLPGADGQAVEDTGAGGAGADAGAAHGRGAPGTARLRTGRARRAPERGSHRLSHPTARVGLVGGLGPESTIDYYRRILEAWERHDPSTMPSIVIDSLDVQLALRLVANDRPALIEYLVASLRRLAGAGVDFVAMTANTPHIVFDEIAARVAGSLAEHRRGLRRGSATARPESPGAARHAIHHGGPVLPEVCARYGIVVIPPSDADRPGCIERYVRSS